MYQDSKRQNIHVLRQELNFPAKAVTMNKLSPLYYGALHGNKSYFPRPALQRRGILVCPFTLRLGLRRIYGADLIPYRCP